MERLRRESPHTGIVLTFFSPSGYEVRKNYRGADIVCYLPADTPRLARRSVETVRPTAAVFVKYEFWGNLLGELQRMEVPTYLISAIFRPRQIFFKPWGGQFRRMLRCFTHIFVQDEASRRLLSGIGCCDATVAGDTRFDRVTDILNTTVDMPCVERFVEDSSFTLIAGSSWPADEDHYISWFNEAPSTTRLIIAPHEFNATAAALSSTASASSRASTATDRQPSSAEDSAQASTISTRRQYTAYPSYSARATTNSRKPPICSPAEEDSATPTALLSTTSCSASPPTAHSCRNQAKRPATT